MSITRRPGGALFALALATPGGGALTGIDKTQFDVAWTGGASYQLPF